MEMDIYYQHKVVAYHVFQGFAPVPRIGDCIRINDENHEVVAAVWEIERSRVEIYVKSNNLST